MNPPRENPLQTFNKNNSEGTNKSEIMVRAAWMYFMESMTQQEIAEHLGISRIKVVRLIQEAREQGIVEIKVNSTITEYLKLESDLRELYNLTEVVVTSREEEGELPYTKLASTAARILEQRLRPGIKVGIGNGRTISHLPEGFAPSKQVDCTFISLSGGLSSGETIDHSFETIFKLASMYGGNARYIYAPFLVSNSDIRDALVQDKAIVSAIEQAKNTDLAIFSVGIPDEFALLHQFNLITDEELTELRARGAVGDALGRFYDETGQEINTSYHERVIGLTIDELRTIPDRILVAGRSKKNKAIKAALIGKLANILVTDADTAQWLLERENWPSSKVGERSVPINHN